MSIGYLYSSDTVSILTVLLLLILIVRFHRFDVIFFHYDCDRAFVRFLVLDEEGPTSSTHESTDLTVAGIRMTGQVAFISWRLDHYLGFILFFNSFICLVRDFIDVSIIEVSLAVVASNDQDLIVASE